MAEIDVPALTMAFRWLAGLAFAIVVGDITVRIFLKILRGHMGLSQKVGDDPETKPVPPWFMGAFERVLFVIVAGALGGQAAVIAAGGWLGLKLASNWGARSGQDYEVKLHVRVIRFHQTALLAGVISAGIGIVGGLVANGAIDIIHMFF